MHKRKPRVDLRERNDVTDRVATHGKAKGSACCCVCSGRYNDSEEAQLELPRLMLYLANGIFIMSERGMVPRTEDMLQGSMVFVPRGQRKVSREVRGDFVHLVSPPRGPDVVECARVVCCDLA